MIRAALLPEPGGALAGEDLGSLGVASINGVGVLVEVGVERPASRVMQIDRARLAALGVNNGEDTSALVNLTVFQTKGGHLADAQRRPVGQRDDRAQSARVLAFKKRLEDVASGGGQ